MIRALRRVVGANRRGVTAAEYAILAVGVVIMVGAAVAAFGPSLRDAFTLLGTEIDAVQTTVSGGGGSGGVSGNASR